MENYKQKYEQAFERAKDMYEQGMMPERIKYIFPELKESEDERIRKELIMFLECCQDTRLIGNEKRDKWILWLEKQGEYANFRNKIQIGDKVTRNEDGVLVNLSQFKRMVKQREQKPTDKFKPKFKVGDTIINKYFRWDGNRRIREIIDGKYIFDGGSYINIKEQDEWTLCLKPKFKIGDWVIKDDVVAQILDKQEHAFVGLDTNGKDFVCNYNYTDSMHLWTIYDAKDGDILEFADHGRIVIGIVSHVNKVTGKVDVNCLLEGNNFKLGNYYALDTIKPHPATKEQCDFLFSKMKELGYKWDSNKKELIKQ